MKIKCPQRLIGQIANFSPSVIVIICHLWHFSQKIFLFISILILIKLYRFISLIVLREAARTYRYHFRTVSAVLHRFDFDLNTFARFYFGSSIFAMNMIGRTFAQNGTKAAITDTIQIFSFHFSVDLLRYILSHTVPLQLRPEVR